MGFTFVMALVNGAETAGISMTGLEEVLKAYVPLHTYGMGWIPFAIVGFVDWLDLEGCRSGQSAECCRLICKTTFNCFAARPEFSFGRFFCSLK